MSENIENLIEFIEKEPFVLDNLTIRADKIPYSGIIYLGYGPPDICYLIKEEKASLFHSQKKQGYYHYIVGCDTSSVSSISAYIHKIISKSEKNSFNNEDI